MQPSRPLKDVASSREALDLRRANAELVRRIREVHDHVIGIEDRYGLTATSRYDDLSHEFMSPPSPDRDIVMKRALHQRLRHELSEHRRYLTQLKVRVRTDQRSKPVDPAMAQ
jgi:hypothetical protein